MNTIAFLNGAAELWSAHLPRALWQTALVALLALVALRLGRRWPAPLRYGLLLVALLKFAMPVSLTSPIALLGRLETPTLGRAILHHAAPRAGSRAPRRLGTTAPPLAADRAPAAHPSVTLTGRAWMLGVYLLGFVVTLAWIAWQHLRLRQMACACRPAEERRLLRAHEELCRRLGLRRHPRLLLSDRDQVPVAFGLLTPTVVLPRRLVRELAPADVRIVLAHELAHHRRGDPWLNGLQIVLSAAWWFDPFYWLVSRQVRSVREDCCDDLVLARGLSSGESYCETLLRAARLASAPVPLGAVLAYGRSAHPLRRRLIRVMRGGFRPAPELSLPHLALILALALVLLPGATSRSETISPHRDQGLRYELHSNEAETRARAALRLGKQRGDEVVAELVALLSDGAPIARALEWDGPSDWSPALKSWLQPSPGEVAAIALASMGREAAGPLIGALGKSDATARRNAAWALGELHNPRLPGLPEVPPLVNALLDPEGHVRAAAAWALGETKDHRAVSPLAAALKDGDSEVRRHAAHALGEIADSTTSEALIDALEDPDERVRETVSWALHEIEDKIQDGAYRDF